LDAGAKAITGGGQVGGSQTFVEPTVLVDVHADMQCVREEIFGPVVVASAFDDLDSVVRQANDSIYGLAASVWSGSLSHAHRLASRLKAGTVWINCHLMYDASLPIGGMKQSGWGRESGQQAVEIYLETKTVCAVI
jgi:phenylacetaldehyde dehydrogenase